MKIILKLTLLFLALLLLFSVSACSTQESNTLPQDKLISLLSLPKAEVLAALALTEGDLQELSSGKYAAPLTVEIQGVSYDVQLSFDLHSAEQRFHSFELSKVYLEALTGKETPARDLASLGTFFTDVYGSAIVQAVPNSNQKNPETDFFFAEHTPEEITETLQSANSTSIVRTNIWNYTATVPETVKTAVRSHYSAFGIADPNPVFYVHVNGTIAPFSIVQLTFQTENGYYHGDSSQSSNP